MAPRRPLSALLATVAVAACVLGAPVASAAAAPVIRPESFGAVGDGHTDDTTALQEAFDAATPSRPVVLTPGRVYDHSQVLHLRVAGMRLTGSGTLLATDEQESSVWIEADDVTVDGHITLATRTTTRRWDSWDQDGLRIAGHSGVVLRDLLVTGAAAAGIMVGNGAADFLLDHVVVRSSRADGIHITMGSHDGQVVSPRVVGTGDDGVAIVSYLQDGAPCHDISVTAPTVLGTTWGRGLSVVGGSDITETDVRVDRSDAAAVYIAAEGSPWFTAAPVDVHITGGLITHANTDTGVDHGAVLVMSGESGVTPADITVSGLTVRNTRATASRDLGVITYGAVPSDVLFSTIAVVGGPSDVYQGNTPQSAYRLRDLTLDGRPLPDAG